MLPHILHPWAECRYVLLELELEFVQRVQCGMVSGVEEFLG